MRRTVITVLVVLSALVAADSASAQILPPQAKVQGASLAGWAERYFVFDAAIPVVNGSHPALDVGDVDCSLGQHGRIWFLETAPEVDGAFERRCTIPAGTGLYVPVFQWFCIPELDLVPVAECLAEADGVFAEIDLSVRVDGQALDKDALGAYRASTGARTLPLVEDSFWEYYLGVEFGPSIEFGADAIGVLVTPLSVGSHEIVITFASETFGFSGSMTYEITVRPGRA